MKYYKIYLLLGLLSILIACSDDKVVDYEKSKSSSGSGLGKYVYNENHEVFYKYYAGGSYTPTYIAMPNVNLRKLKIINPVYAADETSVFYEGHIINNANPAGFMPLAEFPNHFAKDRINKIYYYQDTPLDLDFDTAKIHSLNYISDQYKVLLKDNRWDKVFTKKVPVEDIASFEVINQKITKDKYWLYLENIRLPIASENAKLIETNVIWSQGRLHYIIINPKEYNIPKVTTASLKLEDKGLIARIEEEKVSYHHFTVSGFKNPEYIKDSRWLVDDRGLYYLWGDYQIAKISDERHSNYHFDPKDPQYIRSEKALFANYANKTKIFSASAKIIENTFHYNIVIDNNQLFSEGVLVLDVDAASFIKLKRGFIDKNYYYDKDFRKLAISPQEYKILKNGKLKPENLSGVDNIGNIISPA